MSFLFIEVLFDVFYCTQFEATGSSYRPYEIENEELPANSPTARIVDKTNKNIITIIVDFLEKSKVELG